MTLLYRALWNRFTVNRLEIPDGTFKVVTDDLDGQLGQLSTSAAEVKY
jgi:hypothetical protein